MLMICFRRSSPSYLQQQMFTSLIGWTAGNDLWQYNPIYLH